MLILVVLTMALSNAAAHERVPNAQSLPAQATSQTPSSTDTEQGYRISGTVVDAATGAPLSDAQVSLTSSTTQDSEGTLTDDNGGFAFEDVPAGKYVLSGKRK